VCLYRLLLNGPGLGGLLVVLHAAMDLKGTILVKFNYILYYLSISMNPRYLRTVDEELNPVKATVRVGLAVETVGQAGRPKTITGFQVNHLLSLSSPLPFIIVYANRLIQHQYYWGIRIVPNWREVNMLLYHRS
jgi:hypothetical protein